MQQLKHLHVPTLLSCSTAPTTSFMLEAAQEGAPVQHVCEGYGSSASKQASAHGCHTAAVVPARWNAAC